MLDKIICFGQFNNKSEFCRNYCRSRLECGGPIKAEPASKVKQIMERARLKHRAKQLNLNKQFDDAKEVEEIITNMAYA